ncbi:MAG: hypothetical protein AAF487_02705 [Bacteroidota bacterium]
MKRILAIVFVLGILICAKTPEMEWNGDPMYPVLVYSSNNAKGDMERLTLGIYPEIDYYLDWKRGFSSVHLKEGYEIMCYSFLSFQGEKHHLSESSMNIEKDAGFRPLSLKIIKTKEPEACTNYINFHIPQVKNITDAVRLKAEEKFWDEASSFCSSCGEQIGIDFEKSGLRLRSNELGTIKVSGTVNCLTHANSSFFDNYSSEIKED